MAHVSIRLLAGILAIAAASTLARGTPESELESIRTMDRELPPWQERGADGRARKTREPLQSEIKMWRDGAIAKKHAALLAFLEAHPTAPEHWMAAVIYAAEEREFICQIKPGFDEAVAAREIARALALVEHDTAARALWQERSSTLLQAALEASDAPAEAVGMAISVTVMRASEHWTGTREELLAYIKTQIQLGESRVPQAMGLNVAYERYMALLGQVNPSAKLAEFRRIAATSPNSRRAQWAAGQVRGEESRTGFAMAFSSLDGREIDTVRMKGKVILVDFWATWCGPCIAEMPRLKKLHADYHDKGLEIIGVSLDSEKDRTKFRDLVATLGIPWPQHFDGRGSANAFAARFGVTSIPEAILVDREGRLAKRDLRGEALEAEIHKLLGL